MIQLFPNGDGQRGAGFISVFIGLYKFDKGRVSLQVEFSFIDEVDKQNTKHLRTRQLVELYGNYGVGYRRFIAREALEKLKHLKGDRFTIRCDFIVTGSRHSSISRRTGPTTDPGSAGLATSGR